VTSPPAKFPQCRNFSSIILAEIHNSLSNLCRSFFLHCTSSRHFQAGERRLVVMTSPSWSLPKLACQIWRVRGHLMTYLGTLGSLPVRFFSGSLPFEGLLSWSPRVKNQARSTALSCRSPRLKPPALATFSPPTCAVVPLWTGLL